MGFFEDVLRAFAGKDLAPGVAESPVNFWQRGLEKHLDWSPWKRAQLENALVKNPEFVWKPSWLKGRTLPACVRVKTTARGVTSLCKYPDRSGLVSKRMTRRALAALATVKGKFNKCRETRRGVKIAGRDRYKPAQTSWTSHARSMVMDGAHVIETSSEGVGFFLTLTVPGSTAEGFNMLSVASGYIIDRLNRWMRYKVEGGKYIYVWELQKRGAPHLHVMFRMRSTTDFKSFYTAVRAQWRKILLDVSDQVGVDLFERREGGTWRENEKMPVVNFKVIKHTYAKYLSKYVSKTRSKSGGKNEWCPGRWWAMSAPLRKEVQSMRLSVTIEYENERQAEQAMLSVEQALKVKGLDFWATQMQNAPQVWYMSVQGDRDTILKAGELLVRYAADGERAWMNFSGVMKHDSTERKQTCTAGDTTEKGTPPEPNTFSVLVPGYNRECTSLLLSRCEGD